MFPPTPQGCDKPVYCHLQTDLFGVHISKHIDIFLLLLSGESISLKKKSQSDSLKIPVCNHYICPKSPRHVYYEPVQFIAGLRHLGNIASHWVTVQQPLVSRDSSPLI